MAVLRYDPSHGVSLIDFATPTIIGELRKHFRDKCWSVRPPRRLQELRPRVRETQQELEQKLGRAPTSTEVADALGLTAQELADVERAATGYQPLSLEHPTGEGSSTTLGHLIPDDDDDLNNLMDEMTVHTLLDCLTPRQRKIIELRYFSEMTQQEIANEGAALAVLSMTTAFAGGDLVGGIVNGLRQLADQAGRPTRKH